MSLPLIAASAAPSSRPVHLTTPETLDTVLSGLPAAAARFVRAQAFSASAGAVCLYPLGDGDLGGAVFGLGSGPAAGRPAPDRVFLTGKLARLLPAGDWHLAGPVPDETLAALSFALSGYAFKRYKGEAPEERPRLVVGDGVDIGDIIRQAEAVAFGQDLINTPANDLGPSELAAAARDLAERYGASVREYVGRDLIAAGFPLVHAVGAGSDRSPRLVDFNWGRADLPKVSLVGKGVVYDTGGLDIKPSSAMALMKKDMGGAACTLALARMILDAGLPVRLRVIVPCVENAISGRSFRTGDVYPSRKGLTVEIGNTDAEGRLILADALALADEEAPDLLIDMSTLTGAARVGLGPDLPAFFSRDDIIAEELTKRAMAVFDPVWRLPLWDAYAPWLESKIAAISHVSSQPFAGAITAALFLDRFVENAAHWLHFDLYGWSRQSRPGRPEGGAVQAARACFDLIRARYS